MTSAPNPARLSEAVCDDCGRDYTDAGWCDTVVSNETWRLLSPTGDEGGLLCFWCMTARAAALGLRDEPIFIRSGPWRLSASSQRAAKLRAALEKIAEECSCARSRGTPGMDWHEQHCSLRIAREALAENPEPCSGDPSPRSGAGTEDKKT